MQTDGARCFAGKKGPGAFLIPTELIKEHMASCTASCTRTCYRNLIALCAWPAPHGFPLDTLHYPAIAAMHIQRTHDARTLA
eukprot:6797030-Alexandrium_andersonii.AAC.1